MLIRLIMILLIALFFAGCAGFQVPTSFGLGDPSDKALSCVEDKATCIKHCEAIRDGKVVGFTDTPIEGCVVPTPLSFPSHQFNKPQFVQVIKPELVQLE